MVHVDTDMFISESILRHGTWEPCETRLVVKLLQAETDFLDLGANIGWYTIIAAKVLSGRGNVHAFEPDPTNFSLLMKNISINSISNSTCNNVGASDHASGARLFLDTKNKGDHRLYDSVDGRDSLPVRTILIDAYDGIDRSRALIVKIDTQGSEVHILRGMKNLIDNHPKEIVLICEFWPFGLTKNGTSAAELIRLISDAGFEPFMIGETSLIETDWQLLRARAEGDLAPSTGRHADFVAFRNGMEMKYLVADMIHPNFGSTLEPVAAR